MTTTDKQLPANIMLEKWADIGFFWQGVLTIAELPRLAEQAEIDGVLAASVALAKADGIIWLNYQLSGTLLLQCQRCLEPLSLQTQEQYRLAVLADETQTALIDDADYLLLDELGAGNVHKLPIKQLMEDELLLGLPLSPRHDDCQMLINDDDTQEQEPEDNPFAILAGLKGKLS